MSGEQTKWQTHYHVPHYHNKKTTSLAAAWQSTYAFPLASVSPEMILYITVLMLNVSLLFQLLKTVSKKFVISYMVWSISPGSIRRRIWIKHWDRQIQIYITLFVFRLTTNLTNPVQCRPGEYGTLFKKSHPRQICTVYFLLYFYMNINKTCAFLHYR